MNTAAREHSPHCDTLLGPELGVSDDGLMTTLYVCYDFACLENDESRPQSTRD